ncbi:protein-disulfide reductase DsbD family protein [Aureibacter tunicatorum]|uniref:Thiol:disulfide interchange protein DsbD n=1 Tax=Aureibacter tunicatorum TaxID=866807 RepID=A0AAE3XIH3_9BACT|nr:cytochrome c biogenesis protein CcdA [Aureibacter tunicatorum]MDR6237037.1 thiol:disulfide interchange protein DsbD [Aureibacter tunicatorum]BDD06029.1 thiol:disulfide interchange protein [Aureibacter tunicatorum]
MKKACLLLFFILAAFSVSNAQIIDPVSWRIKVKPENYQAGQMIEIVFEADIDSEWYMYSSDLDPKVGPEPTKFHMKSNETIELIGGVESVDSKTKYDSIFEGRVKYFKGTGFLLQKAKALTKKIDLKGSVTYQVCSEESGQCVPLEKDFVVEGNSGHVVERRHAEASENDNIPDLSNPNTFKNLDKKKALKNLSNDNGTEAQSEKKDKGLLGFAITAFLAGLAALLTPCVFPMIPMTVTFFTGKSASRSVAVKKAIVFGFSIIFIYTLAGTLVSALFGADFANWLSTHWLPNILFFLIFFVFALSFLGMFDIILPAWLVNKIDSQADKGGYYGVFFMAFTLVVVSFSCTGPIAGSILVQSAQGKFIKPIIGMLSFSFAFAIPFTFFAVFPKLLASLPKSGGWLNSVKVTLGFLELALALKFLSIVDLVYHWQVLDREIYLSIWLVIFSTLGFYLFGKIKLKNDSQMERLPVLRMLMGMGVFSFVLYMVPGLWGAPLKPLSGYLPPLSTQDFNLENTYVAMEGGDSKMEICDKPKYRDLFKLPYGLLGYFDYEQALKCAKEMNKPIFLDFTGRGCVNCREMEARVWSDPMVQRLLREDFIILSLYVDDKTDLPQSEWYTSKYDGRVKKTIGAQNADFQITRFMNNAQPFYLILDTDGDPISQPYTYDLDVSHFLYFLENGLLLFEKNSQASSLQ